jgi:hypothetical protein
MVRVIRGRARMESQRIFLRQRKMLVHSLLFGCKRYKFNDFKSLLFGLSIQLLFVSLITGINCSVHDCLIQNKYF